MAEVPRTRRRRWGRWIAGGIAVVVVVPLVALVAAYLYAQSESGKAWLAQTLSSLISTPGETEVAIGRIEGTLPHDFQIYDVAVSDAEGVWLTADRIALAWQPTDLLTRLFHVTALHVDDLEVARLPVGGESAPSGEPFQIPSLLVDVAIDDLAVRDVVLVAPVLGETAAFRIEGRAGAQGSDRLTTALTIERTDGEEGRASLDAVYLPDGERLTLDLQVSEPAGGLLARALALPDLPAVSISLAGKGALADWAGELSVAVDQTLAMGADLTLARTDQTTGFRLIGSATNKVESDALPWRLTAGETIFEIAGAWQADESVFVLDRLLLDGTVVHLAVNGRLAVETMEVAADVDARLNDPSVIAALAPDAGFAAESLTLAGHIEGPVMQPRIEATATAEGLAAPGVAMAGLETTISIVPDAPLAGDSPRAAVVSTGRARGLAVEGGDAVNRLLDAPLAWRLEGAVDLGAQRIEVDDLVLSAGEDSVRASGTVGLETGLIDAGVSLGMESLAALSPLLGFDIAGTAVVEAWIELTGFGAAGQAIVTGEVQDLTLGHPLGNAVLAGRSTLATNLMRGTDGVIAIEALTLDTPTGRIEADATLSADLDRIDASYTATVGDLAILSDPLGIAITGAGTASGTAVGPVADPRITGSVVLNDAAINDIQVARFTLDYTAQELAGALNGRFDVTAETQFGTAKGGAAYRLEGEAVALNELRLAGLGAEAEGALTAPLDGRAVSGTVRLRASDMTPLLALAGLKGGGGATATVRLSGEAAQAVAVDATLSQPRLVLDGGDAVSAARVELSATANDVLQMPTLEARVDAGSARYGDIALERLRLTAEGTTEQARWTLATSGQFQGPMTLEAAGTVALEPESLTLEVARASGRAFDQPIRLQRAVTFTQAGNGLRLTPLALTFGAARLTAEAAIDAQTVSAQVRVQDLALASVQAVAPTRDIEGRLSGTLSLAGPRSNPRGDITLRLSGLRAQQVADAPPVDLALDGRWANQRLNVTGALSGMPGQPADLNFALPLRLDAQTLALSVPQNEAMSGRLAWSGNIGSLWPLVPQVGNQLSGPTELAVTIGGTPANPDASGSFRLTNGTFENLIAGTLLRDLTVALTFTRDRVVVSELRATDGGNGRLSAQGEAAIDPERGFPFKVTATLRDFTAVRRDEVTASTNGDLTMAGSLDRMTIGGTLTTQHVEIRIPDTLPPRVVDLKVIERGGDIQPAATNQQEVIEAEGGTDIRLDLGVAMPRRVFVRGRGLDSEWQGDLKVSGSLSSPSVQGQLNLVRGQLTLLTKLFRLRSGNVRFPGGGDLIPILSVTAEHDAGELTAIAEVSGPATNPEIKLSSIPPVPQDEIVARVLFGKDSSKLSGLEAAQLAAALAELTGRGGDGGLLGKARSVLGVDVLNVETNEVNGETSPALSAGKYVTDKVFVGVKQGVATGSSAVSVEVELTPNISVESETNATGESDIGVKFKWDY